LSDVHAEHAREFKLFQKSKLLDVINRVGSKRYFHKIRDHHGYTIYKSPHGAAQWHIFESENVTEENVLESWLGSCNNMHKADTGSCVYHIVYKGMYQVKVEYIGQFYANTRELTELFTRKLDNYLLPKKPELCK